MVYYFTGLLLQWFISGVVYYCSGLLYPWFIMPVVYFFSGLLQWCITPLVLLEWFITPVVYYANGFKSESVVVQNLQELTNDGWNIYI